MTKAFFPSVSTSVAHHPYLPEAEFERQLADILQLLKVAPLYLKGKMQSLPPSPLHPKLAADALVPSGAAEVTSVEVCAA